MTSNAINGQNFLNKPFPFLATVFTDKLIHSCTLTHDNNENACYEQCKLVFNEDQECSDHWSIGTSHCCLAVISY